MSTTSSTDNGFQYKPIKRIGYAERIENMRASAITVLRKGLHSYQRLLADQSAVTVDYYLLHEVLNEAGSLARAVYGKHPDDHNMDNRVASFLSVLTVSGLVSVKYAHAVHKEFTEHMKDQYMSSNWDFLDPVEYRKKDERFHKNSSRRDGIPDSEPVIPRLLYAALIRIDFDNQELFTAPERAEEIYPMFTNFEMISGSYRRILKDAEPMIAQNYVLNDVRLSRMVERGELSIRSALIIGVVTGNYTDTYAYSRRRYSGKNSYMDPATVITTVFDTFKSPSQRALVLEFILEFLLSSKRQDALDFDELIAVMADGMEGMPFDLVDQMVRITSEDLTEDPNVEYQKIWYESPWREMVKILYKEISSVKSAGMMLWKSAP
jgi:hypothetical protein